ncbi:ComEA family DNA-binding protein [Corynebacterium uterequi]|uniref:Competence protein ComEA-like protein with helix-hairpin-helix repeat region n=1 Tax=Corynebacterium uterequi TaxID=1072256 RepID=A0A0G3HEC1_9CORY|nr:ComEA family DNA-binding protein [Corynebacterium uterequi]AKK11619.1 competence protein ComEA-like protein with helix-hairpin-helix repeat region [Corynebacterium uterequi]
MKISAVHRLPELTAPTGEEEHLAVAFPDEAPPRIGVPSRVAAIAAGLVIAVALAIAVRWWPPGDSHALPAVALPSAMAPTSAPPHGSASAPAAGPSSDIVVSVVGAVATPGLVTLPPRARVADALNAAGGAVPGVDPAAVNLAQLIVDGQQIVVPAPGEPVPPPQAGPAPAAPGAAASVSLNSASLEQLQTLPGVGEATAAAIVAYREEVGGFASIEQLEEVPGIGPAKLAGLRDQVVL